MVERWYTVSHKECENQSEQKREWEKIPQNIHINESGKIVSHINKGNCDCNTKLINL